ncbi:MAG: hypothetical protein IJT70_06360 [Clostridia bacterium]|nr:hypothetical protein [Clostridia bacterium]
MLIRIINGMYGHHDEGGSLVVKDRNSPPFEVEDAEAERLIRDKVAEYAGTAVATPAVGAKQDVPVDNSPEAETAAEGAETDDIAELKEVVEYSADMKAQELRDIAARFGITFPAVCSKAKMVAALDEYFADFDGVVDLTPADPE